jgi:hypothetical protein
MLLTMAAGRAIAIPFNLVTVWFDSQIGSKRATIEVRIRVVAGPGASSGRRASVILLSITVPGNVILLRWTAQRPQLLSLVLPINVIFTLLMCFTQSPQIRLNASLPLGAVTRDAVANPAASAAAELAGSVFLQSVSPAGLIGRH